MGATADLSIDDGVCSGHGRCYATAPELFEPDDDEGKGIVIAQPSGDQVELAGRAARSCPEQAVRVSVLTTTGGELS